MREETKIVTETRKIYVALDGTEFDDKLCCIDYEDELKRKQAEQSVEDLRIQAEAEWPGLQGNMNYFELLYFRINSKEDLERVEKAYQLTRVWSFRDLKDKIHYPDILCVVDDDEGFRCYLVSELVEEANQFLAQFGRQKLTDPKIIKAEQVLIDNGIEAEEAPTVLQAIGYALLDAELYPD